MLKVLRSFLVYLFGRFVGYFFYPKELFKSKYFSHYNSKGWLWLFKCFFSQKILGINRHVNWPVSQFMSVVSPQNIFFDFDDLNNFMNRGCYFQALRANLTIGRGTFIAQNVGIITENHSIYNPAERAVAKDVFIGNSCWIGMNSIILPGVVLGDNTTVGAGSVVTKSFLHGNCIIAGNPAKVIKLLK